MGLVGERSLLPEGLDGGVSRVGSCGSVERALNLVIALDIVSVSVHIGECRSALTYSNRSCWSCEEGSSLSMWTSSLWLSVFSGIMSLSCVSCFSGMLFLF